MLMLIFRPEDHVLKVILKILKGRKQTRRRRRFNLTVIRRIETLDEVSSSVEDEMELVM